MSSRTWMPLYWADLLTDTVHLSAAELGAYMRLLGRYWVSGEPLDADLSRLRRITGMTEKEWSSSRAVLAGFFEERDGKWHHGRVDAELLAAAEKYERRASAGRKGGHAKASGIAVAMLEQSESESVARLYQLQLHSSLRSESPSLRSGEADQKSSARGSRLPDDWQPSEEAVAWAGRELPQIDHTQETEKFRDYWRAKPGKDGRKSDWMATWRNWMRNARQCAAGARASPPPSLMETIDRVCGRGQTAPRDMGPVIEIEAER